MDFLVQAYYNQIINIRDTGILVGIPRCTILAYEAQKHRKDHVHEGTESLSQVGHNPKSHPAGMLIGSHPGHTELELPAC